MGHMNVRFYVHRCVDGLASFAQTINLGPKQLRTQQLSLSMQEMHIRFHREMHPGTPFIMRAGVIEVGEQSIRLFQEITNLISGDVAATFVVTAGLVNTQSRYSENFPAAIVLSLIHI